MTKQSTFYLMPGDGSEHNEFTGRYWPDSLKNARMIADYVSRKTGQWINLHKIVRNESWVVYTGKPQS